MSLIDFFTTPNEFHALAGSIAFVLMWGAALGKSITVVYKQRHFRRFIPLLVTLFWGYLLIVEPTAALYDLANQRAHPPEAALRTTCMAILYIWFATGAGFNQDPVRYAQHPVLAPQGRGLLLTILGFAGIVAGIVLLLRSAFLTQLVPPNPSWFIFGATGILVTLVGLSFAIIGITSTLINQHRDSHVRSYHQHT